MSCLSTEELQSQLAGRALPADRAAHLLDCTACSARLAALREGQASTLAGATSGPRPVGLGLTRGTPVGRYLVLERLGAGGMGEVYAAYDPELDRKVALKLLREPTASEQLRTRLLREAQAMARLAHPNVVSVFDAGTHQGQVFLAMELVEGVTLTTWLQTRARPWHEVVAAFVAAGRGLAAAHAAGLVHRDFKPDNVLVGKDGRIRVTDFGLAHLEAAPASPEENTAPRSVAELSLTTPGELLGTPAYMAPEQFAGRPADPRTDQFNFCAALYEALYGQRPFAGESFAELAQAVSAGAVRPPPRSLVPARVRELVLRGLRLTPEERHPSLEGLLAELERDPAALRRRLALAALAAVAGLALAVLPARAILDERARCAREAAGYAALWSPERAAAVAQALGGQALGARAVERLAALTGELAQAAQEVCEAERAGLAPAAATMRRECLDRVRVEVDALAGLLSEGGPQPDLEAQFSELYPVGPCRGLEPERPLDEARDRPFRPALSRARFLNVVGRVKEARAVLAQVAQEAADAGALHSQAVAAVQGALVNWSGDDVEASLVALRQAERLAEAAGDDHLLLTARISRVVNLGQLLNRYAEAEEAARDARATLVRVHGYPLLEARLDRALGNIAVGQGKPEGVAQLERAAEIYERLFGPESPEVSWPLNDLGRAVVELQHDPARAAGLFERAARLWEAVHGSQDPSLSTFWGNTVGAWLEAGQPEKARPILDKACALAERHAAEHPSDLADLLVTRAGLALDAQAWAPARADLERASSLYGPKADSTSVADLELKWAQLELAMGKPGAARAHAERAVANAEQRPGEAEMLAEARFALARALPAREKGKALALARSAKALVEHEPDGPLAKRIEAWLK